MQLCLLVSYFLSTRFFPSLHCLKFDHFYLWEYVWSNLSIYRYIKIVLPIFSMSLPLVVCCLFHSLVTNLCKCGKGAVVINGIITVIFILFEWWSEFRRILGIWMYYNLINECAFDQRLLRVCLEKFWLLEGQMQVRVPVSVESPRKIKPQDCWQLSFSTWKFHPRRRSDTSR
jgi:hypothetical protein